MVKVWRLYLKQQQKGSRLELPIVILRLIRHGKKTWPDNTERLSSLLNGSAKELAAYIPDFGFERYDLTCYSDDEIKGTLMTRVVQLLFKHAFDPDLRTKPPDILSLMKALMGKETGLQYFETILPVPLKHYGRHYNRKRQGDHFSLVRPHHPNYDSNSLLEMPD